MPATIDIRVPVSADEHAAAVAKAKAAGESGLAPYIRALLGFPPRKAGRPPKPPARRPKPRRPA